MNRHPGGAEHTARLLQLAALPAGSRILDMGAGDGEALRLMQSRGYTAVGIDRKPRSELVQEGNFIHTGFPDASFDGILSQCAFFVSGNAPAALREARRLLRPKGVLMLSDVFFEEPAFPDFRSKGNYTLSQAYSCAYTRIHYTNIQYLLPLRAEQE